MAVGRKVTSDELASAFASEFTRSEDIVQGLWRSQHRGVVSFWILTSAIDPVTQQALYQRSSVLYERFPTAEFDVHILNPHWFADDDALGALPPDAERIAFPAP